jgi:hypothetical protein
MPVVVEICELIGPLCDYAQRVFEKSYDDEEATNAREIAMEQTGQSYSRLFIYHRLLGNSRLDGVGDIVQHVFELARLRPQLVQRTRVVPGIVIAPRVAERALIAQMISCCATYLRHGCGTVVEERVSR